MHKYLSYLGIKMKHLTNSLIAAFVATIRPKRPWPAMGVTVNIINIQALSPTIIPLMMLPPGNILYNRAYTLPHAMVPIKKAGVLQSLFHT
jgi:hypothetical protein